MKTIFCALACSALLSLGAQAQDIPDEEIANVLQALVNETYLDADHDLTWGDAAVAAIKQYQSDWQMETTGTVTPDLASRILRDHPATESQWLKDRNGCAFWNQLPAPQEEVSWSGPCIEGKGSGTGIQVFRSVRKGKERLSSYFGDMRDGKAHGQGRYIGWNGFSYEGGFVDDVAHGQGRMRLANGTVIIGTFKNNGADGQAEKFWPWGEHYKGAFVDDLMEGQGTFTFADGSTYVGAFRGDYFEGQGKVSYPDGGGYEGAWARDRPNGQGTAVINGETYTGTWKNGCLPLEDGKHAWVFSSKQECEAQEY